MASTRTLRAVDYLRVSTEEQKKGYGVARQSRKTTRHIALKQWAHAGTYKDEGVSGSLEAADRGDLKRLMDDAQQTPRPFDIVVVPDGRVIGRKGRAFWRWVWALEDIGVYVADDYDNTTTEGRKKMRRDAPAPQSRLRSTSTPGHPPAPRPTARRSRGPTATCHLL